MNKEAEVVESFSVETLYQLVDEKQWEEASSFLSTDGREEEEEEKHKLKLAVKYQCPTGRYTPFSRAIFLKAPYPLIKLMLDIGGKDLLKIRDKYESTPLHTAFALSNPEVIQLLTDMSDLDDLVKSRNKHQRTPVESLLALGNDAVEAVLIVESKLYKLDPEVKGVPRKIVKSLLTWTFHLPEFLQDEVLKSSLIKVALNNRFVEPGCLVILLADIYAKFAITWVYSFMLYDIINGRMGTTGALIVLGICFYWTLSREISQCSSTYLRHYITDPVNCFDILQLVLLGLSLKILTHFDGNLPSSDRAVFMCAIFVSWIEILFVVGTLIKGIAEFAVALIKIFGKLGPYIFTTAIFLAMFSHIFIMANVGDKSLLCNTGDAELDDWTCSIPSSYVETTVLFLTAGLAYDTRSAGTEKISFSILFGFAIGVVFLNISIAVITDFYNQAKVYESRAFTRKRLAFAAGSQSLISIMIFNMVCVDENNESSGAPHRNNRKPRISFNQFPDWEVLENFDSDEEKAVLQWWFRSWEKPSKYPTPNLALRLKVFFQKASYEEIMFPGLSFEQLLKGSRHREKKKQVLLSILARIASYLLFTLNASAMLIVFCAGCLSFGLLWPPIMREHLFHEETSQTSGGNIAAKEYFEYVKQSRERIHRVSIK